jgi:ATPase family associated with various cellular activities (AAA)
MFPTRKKPAFVAFLRKHKSKLKLADELLKLRMSARLGGPLDKILATISAIGLVSDEAFPNASSWRAIEDSGHQFLYMGIGGFLCDLLYKSDLSKHIVNVGDSPGSDQAIVRWPTLDISAIYDGTKFSEGPFGTPGSEVRLQKAVQDIIWKQGKDFMLAVKPETPGSYFKQGADRFSLEEMPAPGAYLGEKPVSWYAQRLSVHGASEPRSALLIGPSGAGKSVLARLIAKELSPGTSTRTLKIASNVLKTCRYDEVLSLVQSLKPTVLLLDDCNLSDSKYTEEFLAILEALHQPGCLVFVTMMTEKKPDDIKRGSLCFPGMRPGRIDESFVLGYPDEALRAKIISHYMGDAPRVDNLYEEVAKATEGVTGAYLREIARRIVVFGSPNWEEEVQRVMLTAPAIEAVPKKEGASKGIADALASVPVPS